MLKPKVCRPGKSDEVVFKNKSSKNASSAESARLNANAFYIEIQNRNGNIMFCVACRGLEMWIEEDGGGVLCGCF